MSKDKIIHFTICFVSTVLVGLAAGKAAGAAGAAGLGIGKEYGDSRAPGNRWDNWDLLADFAGIVAGLIVVWAIGEVV